MDIQDLVKIRKQAEQAVADMPDGPIKTKAFEIIFSNLVTSATTPSVLVEEAEEGKEKPPRVKEPPSPKKKMGPQGHIERLQREGFFYQPRSLPEIQARLKDDGLPYPQTSLSTPLQRLVQPKKRILRRTKVKEDGKTAYKYTNW